MKLEQFFIPSNQADARLEIVAAKPQHQGPNPTIVFNHGSTGRGTTRPSIQDRFLRVSWQTTSLRGGGWFFSRSVEPTAL
jgi:hypothetical protein